jgi:hypothetical protein
VPEKGVFCLSHLLTQDNHFSEAMPEESTILIFVISIPWDHPQWAAMNGRKLEEVAHQDHHGQAAEEVSGAPIKRSGDFAVAVDHAEHAEIHHAYLVYDHNHLAGPESP